MFDDFNFDYIKELKDALAAASEDYSEANWLDVVSLLTDGIKDGSELLIPVAKLAFLKIEFDPDAEFEDIFPDELPDYNYNILEMPDGRRWLPLFTDDDEAIDMVPTNDIRLIPRREAFELTLLNEELDGIIINLFSDIFLITRQHIEMILEEIDDEGYADAG